MYNWSFLPNWIVVTLLLHNFSLETKVKIRSCIARLVLQIRAVGVGAFFNLEKLLNRLF